MTGTKGKSGGKREGAGHPTLIEQFDNAVNFEGDTKKAVALFKKIEARQRKLQAELAQIKEWERSREYNGIAYIIQNGG